MARRVIICTAILYEQKKTRNIHTTLSVPKKQTGPSGEPVDTDYYIQYKKEQMYNRRWTPMCCASLTTMVVS